MTDTKTQYETAPEPVKTFSTAAEAEELARRFRFELKHARHVLAHRHRTAAKKYTVCTCTVGAVGQYKTAEGEARMLGHVPALRLANAAQVRFDEHGGTSARGDHHHADVLDYVPPKLARKAPYLDSGGRGLALVAVTRRRVYAKSSKWYPRETVTHYLVGRNEAETAFAHAVSPKCRTVLAALSWMWRGYEGRIVARQGDVAVIVGSGPNQPLPAGHQIEGAMILHATHPPIRVPEKGQRIIVARRALARVAGETRD